MAQTLTMEEPIPSLATSSRRSRRDSDSEDLKDDEAVVDMKQLANVTTYNPKRSEQQEPFTDFSARSFPDDNGQPEYEDDDDEITLGKLQMFQKEVMDGCRQLWVIILGLWARLTKDVMWKFFLDRVPVVEWMPRYTLQKFGKDLQAGLVVGCMLIPQGMGYADVAGLPFVAGLYSGFAPLMLYFLFGTSRQMGVGPVAIVSLLVAQGVPACSKLCVTEDGAMGEDTYPECPETCPDGLALDYNPAYWQYATCIALMSGVIQVVLGPVLGFVMNFVPHPVISGFTSAGGLIIAMSQLKDIMGYPIHKKRLQSGIYDFFSQLHKTHVTTCVMGVAACVFLSLVRKLGQGKLMFFPRVKVPNWVRLGAKLPWAFILVIIYILVTYSLRLDKHGVKITGQVPSGLPPLALPHRFFERVPKLLSITIQIVIIGYLESIAVETKFATMLKYQVRPTQEAVAQGLSNIIGGLTSCYPVVGSFSRSATNASYESQSPMCNLITGFVIMLTLLFLTNLFHFMPKNVLAAIVIVAAINLVDPHEAMFLFRSSKKEFFLLLITFVLTAFVALELGIYVAVGLCGAEVLIKSTRPKVAVLSENFVLVYLPGAAGLGKGHTLAQQLVPQDLEGRGVLIVRVEGDLNFSAASALKNIVSEQFNRAVWARQLSVLIFDLAEMDIVDTTALHALIALVEEIEGNSVRVFMAGVPPGLVHFLKIDAVKDKLSKVDFNQSMKEVTTKYQRISQSLDLEEGGEGAVARVRSRVASRVASGGGSPLARAAGDGNTSPHHHHRANNSARFQQSLAEAVDAAFHEDDNRRRSRELQHADTWPNQSLEEATNALPDSDAGPSASGAPGASGGGLARSGSPIPAMRPRHLSHQHAPPRAPRTP